MTCIVVVLLDELAGTPRATVARERAETRMDRSCMAEGKVTRMKSRLKGEVGDAGLSLRPERTAGRNLYLRASLHLGLDDELCTGRQPGHRPGVPPATAVRDIRRASVPRLIRAFRDVERHLTSRICIFMLNVVVSGCNKLASATRARRWLATLHGGQAPSL